MQILVVEDDFINQIAVQKIIEKFGFTVHIAADYLEVMACMAKQKYDLIFMDIGLPKVDGIEVDGVMQDNVEMNGFEVTRRLRAAGYTMPIIALTANSAAESQAQEADCGLTDVMVKPLSYDTAEALFHKIKFIKN